MGGKKKANIKKDIARAVKSMPGLIMEEVGRIPEEKSPTPPKRNHFLMWFGVFSLSAIIFTMWILNARLLISNTGFAQSKENQILQSAGENMETIMADLKKDEKTNQKDNIGEIKNALIGLLIDSSTTTASTTALVTTTTKDTTTTMEY